MSQPRNNNLLLKTLVMGGFIAALVYFFHPGVGSFSLIINGEPVADPLIRFAAIPTLLIAMLFTGILMFLAFLGVGMFMFIAALAFIMLGVFMVAPYFWPVLVIIFLVIVLMSIGNTKDS
ncbi:hypothetical protein AU255_08120 [Methyloprofundus sedimenti]|uniref:Uncharacterized protein n=1 Tax=Methyloprofundus sedimenti TaxID=1420851 RepID=A0A1V8M8I5_9GAMM|nr:hypothetical protein [Methyloprofundus sedimenti]OQK17816.1 hypothetical protein AU255_08120 [Methyloprofundus sedimenti]